MCHAYHESDRFATKKTYKFIIPSQSCSIKSDFKNADSYIKCDPQIQITIIAYPTI